MLSDDQAVVLGKILDWRSKKTSKHFILTGPAGSGKTSLLKEVLKVFPTALLAAPTGKAAQRMTELTGTLALTLHRRLYMAPEENKEGHLTFKYWRPPCLAGELLIVDEASMLEEKIISDLFKALPSGAQVLFIGDHEQLPPVEGTWGLDLLNPHGHLSKVHRQAVWSGILSYATAIREGNGSDWESKYDPAEFPEVQIYDGMDSALAWKRQQVVHDTDHTFLTFTNQVRQKVNSLCREQQGFNGPLKVGDILLSKTNRYKEGIINGDVFEVTDIKPGSKPDVLEVHSNETTFKLKPALLEAPISDFVRHFKELKSSYKEQNRYVHCHYGHCLTVHSAQGSQWDHVGFLWDQGFNSFKKRNVEDARRFLYTMVTRAIKTLTIFNISTDGT